MGVASQSGLRALTALVMLLSATACQHPSAGRSSSADPVDETVRGALAAALGGRSPLRMPLTGGFAPGTGSGDRSAPTLSPELRKMTRTIAALRGRSTRVSPELLHAEALAIVVTEGRRGGDAAIERLEKAAALSPRSPEILSDLAAVYYERSGASGRHTGRNRPDDLANAFDAADRALALRPDLAEAAFIRATVLDDLGLGRQAEVAWLSFLDLDSPSSWRTRAEERLGSLRLQSASTPSPDDWEQAFEEGRLASLSEQFPAEARNFALNLLMEKWSLAIDSLETRRVLEALSTIAETTVRVAHDNSVAEGIRPLLEAERDPRRRLTLARAHKSYAEALRKYRVQDFAAALAPFREAEDGFRTAGSTMVEWASYYSGICNYQQGRPEAALEAVQPWLKSSRSPYLRARAYWISGLAAAAEDRYGEATHRFRLGLELLKGVSDPAALASMRLNLASVLELSGESLAASQLRVEGLLASRRLADPRLRYLALSEAVQAFLGADELRLARVFVDEMIWAADRWGQPAARLHAYRLAAEVAAAGDDPRSAIIFLSKCEDLTATLPDPVVRTHFEVDIDVEEAALLMHDDPRQALAILQGAESSARRIAYRLPRTRLLLAKGEAHERLGDFEHAAALYREALGEHGDIEASIQDIAQRSAYIEQTQAAFDRLLRLASVELKDSREAFWVAEQSRARTILERWPQGTLPGEAGATRSPALATDELSEGTVFIEYAVLDDRVLSWRIERRGAIEQTSTAITREELRALVARQGLELTSADYRGERGASAELYDLLIRPVLDAQKPKVLVLSPDGPLQRVSFPALFDQRSHRWMIEDSAIVVAPSLRVFLAASLRSRERSSIRPSSILAIGDPAFDPRRFPSLSRLPGADREVRSIGAMYPHATVFTGSSATEESLSDRLRGSEILHFSGHAVFDSRRPQRSALVLAPSDSAQDDRRRDGVLRIGELPGFGTLPLRLVILSACSTASGLPGKRDRSSSWAEAWLLAGVPTVVASVWDVRDGPTSSLLESFHRRLLSGRSPPQALRDAQLALLGRPPVEWAGFQTYGGYSEPDTAAGSDLSTSIDGGT